MKEPLHRLRANSMLITVYEDIITLIGSYSVITLPPSRVVSIRTVPMKLLREGRLEISFSMPNLPKPFSLSIALPPLRQKEAVAQKLVATVTRLRDQGAGGDELPFMGFRAEAPETGFLKPGALEEGTAVQITVGEWCWRPAIVAVCGERTLGYVPCDPKDPLTQLAYEIIKDHGAPPARIKDGRIWIGEPMPDSMEGLEESGPSPTP